MKKNYILVAMLGIMAINSNLKGQDAPTIKTDLPQMIPPSPTVASLMKFEEVPVSNYTGVPDISLPLFSVASNSKDINVNIALKYHTSSVAADEIASDVGLGWNLFAGGTVSRTVKGYPDEELVLASGNKPGKVGVHQTTTANHINNFYYFSNNILNSTKDYYQTNLSAADQETGNEYIWTANRSEKYDTEQDIWQFNFFGRTGRFYIRKNSSGNLEIVPLDSYTVKIINQYDANTLKPTGFTIYDDLGYQYVFDVIEVSNNYGGTLNSYYRNGQLVSFDNLYTDREFNSSFHLSKVISPNNITLITYEYNENEIKEGFTNVTKRITEFGDLGQSLSYIYDTYNPCDDFPPITTVTRSSTLVKTKKLKTIKVTNNALIKFEYIQGRQDSNLMLPENASYLKSVSLSDWDDHLIKKYSFTQNYKTTLDERMFLSKVDELDKNNQLIGSYQLTYEDNSTAGKVVSKDAWGYFNLTDACDSNASSEYRRKVTPSFSTTDILQKIKYPTGGSVVFDFEANRYSYVGDQQVTDFSKSKDYTYQSTDGLSFNNSNTTLLLPTSTSDRKGVFTPSITLSGDPGVDTRSFVLQVYNTTTSQWEKVQNLNCSSGNSGCCFHVILQKNKGYRIWWQNFDLNYNGTDTMGVEYYNEGTANNFLYGGGNRIRRIGYFDYNAPADFYKNLQLNPVPPAKEKKYTYNFEGTTTSSGALADPEPLFKYTQGFNAKFKFKPYGWTTTCYDGDNQIDTYSNTYDVITTENNIPLFKTQGAAVGYKFVTVEDGTGTGKGKTTFEYTSPIDFPNIEYPAGPPFVQPKNYDYKRGNLIRSIVYDNTSRKLSETENQYNYINYEEYTGVKFTKPAEVYNGSNASYPKTYALYKFALNDGISCMECSEAYSSPRSFWGGLPLDLNTPKFIPVPVFETFGWTQLTNTTSKSYFYEGSTQKVIQRNEAFEYNTVNKRISSHTVNKADGGILKTLYYYHTGNSAYSQNRIAEIEKIESYKNNTLVDSKKIIYDNNWGANVSYLPKEIQSAVGAQTLETTVTFNKYDALGNLLQYTTKEGIPVSIVWGYQKTQPIAKVEGITYADLENLGLISAIVSASDTDGNDPSTEGALVTALNNFRNHSALQNYQVTTLTHNPLIGVTTMIPPSGITETYQYDNANRLEKLMDEEGKIVKEFKYNYKQ
ncbi:hypothetical protein [Chryseobacterium daecheongense]|uniref:RHS repeat protein n=1 Tax=Chryseobacterium daecheongense TaxID=192389 RepID=A0A3N0W059_9FLAO|nr:hypothetical protein [Chryseobacterium daecheongense]ROH98160.1 hypothetical protein EGI05_12550 [Chryseobacterium daecheongense]TDX92638.1 hypothetical protein BCF50_1575 [Chryseobacterium daecheongense]